ncbi:putative ribonuclease H protein [Senna tora]|uniref:Putative ribonuclease H protein n=1 Tax=Senna tora TaxID=362788 RepID=A0A835CH15_9FABA|nr:putative ribonuclease H protein [Senna tora]
MKNATKEQRNDGGKREKPPALEKKKKKKTKKVDKLSPTPMSVKPKNTELPRESSIPKSSNPGLLLKGSRESRGETTRASRASVSASTNDAPRSVAIFNPCLMALISACIFVATPMKPEKPWTQLPRLSRTNNDSHSGAARIVDGAAVSVDLQRSLHRFMPLNISWTLLSLVINLLSPADANTSEGANESASPKYVQLLIAQHMIVCKYTYTTTTSLSNINNGNFI